MPTTFAPRPVAPTTKDSAGKTLTAARAESLRMAAAPGSVLVIGKLFANGSLSQTWSWTVRAQFAGQAPHNEEIQGGARFRFVELVPTGTARPAVRIPW